MLSCELQKHTKANFRMHTSVYHNFNLIKKMKTTFNTLILVLSTVILSTACTDNFTGPDEAESIEGITGTLINGPVADLSLRLGVEQIQAGGSVFHKVTAYVHNEGPHDATGVQLALTASAESDARDGGDDDDEPGGGDIILVDIIGPVAAASGGDNEQGGGDIILVDLLGAIPAGSSMEVESVYQVNGASSLNFNSEIMRSDLADPDSTPANGDPEEDDEDIILVDLLGI